MEKIKAFTGQSVLWDEANHGYFTLRGERMESATAYAERKLPVLHSDLEEGAWYK